MRIEYNTRSKKVNEMVLTIKNNYRDEIANQNTDFSDKKSVREMLKRDGLLLEGVYDQDEELCEIAIRQNPLALQYVQNQNNYLCELALSKCGTVIKFVKNITQNMILLAINENGGAILLLRNMNDINEEIYKKAIAKSPWVKEYINIIY